MKFNDQRSLSSVANTPFRGRSRGVSSARAAGAPLVALLALSLAAASWAQPRGLPRLGLTSPTRATAPAAPQQSDAPAPGSRPALPQLAAPAGPAKSAPATKPLPPPPSPRTPATADLNTVRVKDVARIGGTNTNPLVGYGMVIGLQGTGDTQGSVTQQMLTRMLQTLGMNQPQSNNNNTSAITMKNAAVVMLTADLPPYARPGDALNVRVASVADAKSLVGGVLAVSLLKAADGQVYASAQGPLVVGDQAATGVGIGLQNTKPHLTSGIVIGGGLVTRQAPASRLDTATTVQWVLNKPDFEMSSKVAAAINRTLPGVHAIARDSTVIEVDLRNYEAQGPTVEIVAQMGQIPLDVESTKVQGKVTFDTREGELVEGADVRLRPGVVHAAGARIEVSPSGATVGDVLRYLAQLGFPAARRAEVLRALSRDNVLRADVRFQYGASGT